MRRGEHELTVSAGEVVGLFGVAGGPQFDILDCLFGTGTALDEVTLNGHLYAPRGPVEAIASGVHLVPADRETDGLISGMSAIDNVFLPWVRSRKGVTPVSVAARRARYREIREDLGIRGPDGNAAISSFSGGNRQKHLLARWISVREPRLLLLAQPTQGVDEGAKFDIRKAIRRLSEAGGTVLVASAESDEVSSLCDRAYVFGPRGIHHVEASARFDETMLEMVSGEQDHHE